MRTISPLYPAYKKIFCIPINGYYVSGINE